MSSSTLTLTGDRPSVSFFAQPKDDFFCNNMSVEPPLLSADSKPASWPPVRVGECFRVVLTDGEWEKRHGLGTAEVSALGAQCCEGGCKFKTLGVAADCSLGGGGKPGHLVC